MKTTVSVVAGALCAWILLAAQTVAAQAADNLSGNWTMMPADSAGKVNFGLVYRRAHHNMNHSSDWPAEAFQGLDLSVRGKRDVQFSIVREAGRFDCEGYLQNGVGAGVFLFTPDPAFTKALADLGFTGVNERTQFAMATFDVTTKFIRDLRAEGLPLTEVDKVIAFRVHDVTVASVREYKKLGVQADEDQLIAMHVHGATPAWIAKMRAQGYADLDVNQLVAFRVHGVTPEYIAKMEKLGYGRPDPDQLVAMRVHGVTPEYIDGLKSRGVKNLTIDRLIQLRVHGID